MSNITRQLIVALAISLLGAGCSHPTPGTAPTASDTKTDGARPSQLEVVRIAAEAATIHGYRLADYKDPQAHYEFTRKDKTWSVFYDGKVAAPGHHFLVWIDDRTATARVMPGE